MITKKFIKAQKCLKKKKKIHYYIVYSLQIAHNITTLPNHIPPTPPSTLYVSPIVSYLAGIAMARQFVYLRIFQNIVW